MSHHHHGRHPVTGEVAPIANDNVAQDVSWLRRIALVVLVVVLIGMALVVTRGWQREVHKLTPMPAVNPTVTG